MVKTKLPRYDNLICFSDATTASRVVIRSERAEFRASRN